MEHSVATAFAISVLPVPAAVPSMVKHSFFQHGFSRRVMDTTSMQLSPFRNCSDEQAYCALQARINAIQLGGDRYPLNATCTEVPSIISCISNYASRGSARWEFANGIVVREGIYHIPQAWQTFILVPGGPYSSRPDLLLRPLAKSSGCLRGSSTVSKIVSLICSKPPTSSHRTFGICRTYNSLCHILRPIWSASLPAGTLGSLRYNRRLSDWSLDP